MLKFGAWIVGGLVSVVVLAIMGLKVFFGSGSPLPDRSTEATVADARYDAMIALDFPPGMVSVSPEGRLFFTYHSLHHPERSGTATLFEWVGDEAVPFPSADETIQRLFDGSMGMNVDRHNRLWIVMPGGARQTVTRLLAFDLNTREQVFEHTFAADDALFSQDFRISADGNTLFFADTGLFEFMPAYLGVFDVPTKTFRKVLVGHPSVAPLPDSRVLRANGEPHMLLHGLVDFRVGVDGIALSADDQWIYYAAMTHDTAYRIGTQYLLDPSLSNEQLAAKVERLGHKPVSDAIELDADNNLILTDCEHGGLSRLAADGSLSTLVRNENVDWSDSVTIAADGTIYYTDSQLAAFMGPTFNPTTLAEIEENAPYYIYRIQPETSVD